MMLAVPFIYFSFLGLYMYRKRKKIDLAILICIIYAISGFVGLFMGDPGERVKGYHISVIAAVSYCALLTMCLFPIAKFSHLGIKSISPVKNEKLLRALSWAAIIWFLIFVIGSWSQFHGIITGDMLALRTALYNGTADDSYIVSMPFPIRFILSSFSYIFGCYWILIFLAFYCLLIQKLPIKYFLFFLIASLSCPWGAVLGIDRSAVAGYLFSFAGIVVFFWPFMEKKIRRWTVILGSVIIGALIAYLAVITISRFGGVKGEDMEGVNNSLLFYIGHSYLYFCYYFDNFDNPAKMLNLIFPFISKFVFGSEVLGGMRINAYLESKVGGDYGYFYTFLGQIQITAGHIVMIVFCILFFIISNNLLSKRKHGMVTPRYAFLYFFFASFMLLGLFAYFYQSPIITASVVSFLIFFKMLGVRKDNQVKRSHIVNNCNVTEYVKQNYESPEKLQARDGADSGHEIIKTAE